MLALAGFITVVLVLAAILTKRLSPLLALSLIPLVMSLLLGFGWETGAFMLKGIETVAPMAAMFLFAILFFAVLSDAGLFHPIVRTVVRLARDHPPRVALGTAILTAIVHLDGSGAATFLIVVPALVPVYDRLGMDRRALACIVAMAAGVGNMLPWGGPVVRAATALQADSLDIFRPVIPAFIVGMAGAFALAWWIGKKSVLTSPTGPVIPSAVEETEAQLDETRHAPLGLRYWVNVATVVAVLAAMLVFNLSPTVAFLVGAVVAIAVNVRDATDQRIAIETHAPAAITMVAILIAAGSFTGILRGTGMISALAHAGTGVLPDGWAGILPVATGILSMPLSLLFDPDSFYFGVLPVLGSVAAHGGIDPVEIGRAAVLGQMTTGFPISPLTPATFLLVGLSGIDLADHQRYAFKYLFALTLLMVVVAVLTGAISL